MTLRPRRPGFTLLELLLATLIAGLLLAALYIALNMTLRQTQDAKEMVEVDGIARGTFQRMTLDLNGVLGPLPPKSGGTLTSSGGGSTPTTSTPTTSTSLRRITDGS